MCEVLHELSCVLCVAMYGYIILFVNERLCVVFIIHVGRSTHLCIYISVHVFMIFTEDEVYLTNEDECSEYVLNTSGSIWRGTYNNFFAGNWQFDQVSLRDSTLP